MTRRGLAGALLAGAGACTLLAAASQPSAAFTFGISSAAAATAERATASNELSCGAVLDAKGAKVNRQGNGGQVFTSASHRCAAPDPAVKPMDGIAKSAPRRAEPAPLIQADAIPGLSSEPVRRAIGPQDGPLRFAAENPERVGAALLTGSAMLWVLHSSFWTSLLMLGLPLWRHVDLLPIVAAAPDNETKAPFAPPTAEETAVAQMLEERSARPTPAARRT